MRLTSLVLSTAALFLAACAHQPKVDPSVQPAVAPVATPTTPAITATPAVTADGTSHVACEKGKDQRSLDIRTKGGGCELAYTKAGQAAVVASGKHGLSHCESAMKKIKSKLSGSGYACK